MSCRKKPPAEDVIRKPDVDVRPARRWNETPSAGIAHELRRHDVVLEWRRNFRLKKSFEAATKEGAKYILIVGENEVKPTHSPKNLATGEQIFSGTRRFAQKTQA